jgi:RND family efflux transporter MFP subunit
MSEPTHSLRTAGQGRIGRYALILAAIAVLIAIWGVTHRVLARNALEQETATESTPVVVTIQASRGPVSEELVLPGTAQAFYEAPIYARTSGYLKSWETDIGTPVHKGQLLAEIETPEVDQQLRQAQADLATADANYQLAKTTDERWKGLLATQSVSQQDADQRAGDAAAKKAAYQSAAANVARLQELESFKRVLAPFDGIVTQRNTDIGALINAGQNPGNALFHVADLHRLRVYVNVPQSYAAAVPRGLGADLVFADHPGKTYPAKVAFTAQALDPSTRTLQVELQVDNPRNELFPGAYAEVHFKLATPTTTLRLPVNAVMFRATGLQIATVDKDDTLHLQKITEGRDFGKEIEVVAGLDGNERIVINPPDSISDGAKVRVAPPPVAKPGAGPGAPPGASADAHKS